MHESSKIIEFGILQENGDTWHLMNSRRSILVDIPFLPDMSLNKRLVTIVGKMGVPPDSPTEKLIAERIVSHEAIAERAYELWLANPEETVEENWFQAEKELLGI